MSTPYRCGRVRARAGERPATAVLELPTPCLCLLHVSVSSNVHLVLQPSNTNGNFKSRAQATPRSPEITCRSLAASRRFWSNSSTGNAKQRNAKHRNLDNCTGRPEPEVRWQGETATGRDGAWAAAAEPNPPKSACPIRRLRQLRQERQTIRCTGPLEDATRLAWLLDGSGGLGGQRLAWENWLATPPEGWQQQLFQPVNSRQGIASLSGGLLANQAGWVTDAPP
ncbi:hypothetical protein B0T26DRAFT_437476 [Lasiosphaeria miniovina]|uniref:Uncharacterized protein n=1 Tax=Lasiosphaeria miniovina TaxID=1954250 RepID=A0AA39ZYA3_9PEZI|nr:uncharacterized protein B0T26DRAFT_437476 [Lasiosphaeria miniovina]KAK0705883.1 hypothetical protein B0T26DRAFT_437476 [Lasiosphaeria miniovina]